MSAADPHTDDLADIAELIAQADHDYQNAENGLGLGAWDDQLPVYRAEMVRRQMPVAAALDAAGYTIVARDPRPATCPTCKRKVPGYLREGWGVVKKCPDPWHGEGR